MRTIIIVGAILLSQCQVDRRPEYSIVLANAGNTEIQDVVVAYSGFTSISSVVIANAEKGQGGVKVPVPESVTATWRTADGQRHEQIIAVKGRRPFREMVVTFNESTAEVELRE